MSKSKAVKTKKLTWLAHFESGGGQDILAPNREEAIRLGEKAARRINTRLVDITGPDEN